MRKGYADTEVGQVHYREAGAGEAVVLLHQTASSSVMWHRVMPFLAERYRAVTMDTPGFGMSDPPPGRQEDLGYYARAVVGLLDQLELQRASLVGLRTGASVALEVAAGFPERVERAVFSCALFLESEEEREEWRELEAHRRWQPDGRGEFLETHVLEWVREFAREDDGEQYLLELIAALQAGPEYHRAYRRIVEYPAYKRLREVEAPILFLNPTHDNQYEFTKRAHEATPGSLYVEIEGPAKGEPGMAGVATQFPREFSQAVLDFLQTPAEKADHRLSQRPT